MLILRSFLLAFLTIPCAGCLSLHVTRPVEVSVSYAETGEPVAGVTVETEYVGFLVFNVPRTVQTITNSHGKAEIPIATFSPYLPFSPAHGWLAVDRDIGTIRGEAFSYPVSAIIKSTGPIEGELYTLKLRPIRWSTYLRRKRGAQLEHGR